MPTNSAAWMRAKYGQLEVGPAPYTPPGKNQIVVRNHAVAINPLDWIIQVAGPVAYRWLTYPTVIGSDVAGEVVEVGEAVTRFRVGDRVLGHAVGTDKDSNTAAEGAFQEYTVVLERMAAAIPDTLSYESACVLPLTVSTASSGLFQKDQLGLKHPSANADPTGETVLIWGGSTSVGSNAIQLAVAAGYDVITTASPRNVNYVTSLGASQVFDYNSPAVVQDIVAAFQGRTLAGALAIGTGSAELCVDVVHACAGRKFVSIASTPVSFADLAGEDRPRFAPPAARAACRGQCVAADEDPPPGHRHQVHLRHQPEGQRGQHGDLPGLPAQRSRGWPLHRRARAQRRRPRPPRRAERPGHPAQGRVRPEGRRVPGADRQRRVTPTRAIGWPPKSHERAWTHNGRYHFPFVQRSSSHDR
jgi:NADPH:quinone reductase-like Zn-dependent oxidoreductase